MLNPCPRVPSLQGVLNTDTEGFIFCLFVFVCVSVCVHVCALECMYAYHNTHVRVRGQLVGLGSLLSACEMELIIGLGGKHLLTDPSYWPQLMAKACSSV